MKRLAIVVSHPTQYYSPWFRWLAAHSAIEIRVFYLWDFGVTRQRDPKFQTAFKWDVDLLSGYESEFVPNRAADPGTHHFRGLNNPEIGARLGRWAPDAVLLFGYAWLTHMRVIAWARRRGIPLLFRGDSHFIGRGPPHGLRRWLLRTLYRQFHGVLPVGTANADYFTALGVPRQRQFFAPHSVNTELFDPEDGRHAEGAAALRATLGLDRGERVVLFAGKFVPEKQPIALLDAFLGVAERDAVLVFVGDGPERSALQARAADAPGRIFFLPFANQSEMPARYLLADVFALPSIGLYETWGLAVNEAMHMGTPALVSDRVGCQRDLVLPGETGWVFGATDPGALREQLSHALCDVRDPGRRASLRQAARQRVGGYTYVQTTEGLQQALAALTRAS